MPEEEIIKMTRFWFEFDLTDYPHPPFGIIMGCGISACTKHQALEILEQCVFKTQLPPVKKCIENIDIGTLDENHVKPNMASPSNFGVWFPLGYMIRYNTR